jgi:hypothetical protein
MAEIWPKKMEMPSDMKFFVFITQEGWITIIFVKALLYGFYVQVHKWTRRFKHLSTVNAPMPIMRPDSGSPKKTRYGVFRSRYSKFTGKITHVDYQVPISALINGRKPSRGF